MLTFNQINDQPHDCSGIENPHEYYWLKNDGVYYPFKRIEDTAPKKVVIKPTWKGMLKTCLTIYTDGDAAGKLMAIRELEKMAKMADLYAQAVEENRIENGLLEEKEVQA